MTYIPFVFVGTVALGLVVLMPVRPLAADCLDPCSGTEMCVTAQCVTRFEDCGDGTIADLQTGMVWQKTDSDGGLTDSQHTYSYDEAFSKLLSAMNTEPCFAGHCRWRIPGSTELIALAQVYASVAPSTAQDLLGPVSSPESWYWTRTHDESHATIVNLADGSTSSGSLRLDDEHARGVRYGDCTTGIETCRVCGDYSGDSRTSAVDAMGALRAAIGTVGCALCVCDANGNGTITAADAYEILLHAVGVGPNLACPGWVATTTTMSTSTTMALSNAHRIEAALR